MNIIDLSQELDISMPTYSDDSKPVIEKVSTIQEDGYNETRLSIYSHLGTHIDSPFHMLSKGYSLEKFTIDKFVGNAFVLDISNLNLKCLEVKELEKYEKNISNCQFLIIKTGWSKYWGDEKYFIDFPVMTEESAKWLGKFSLKGIGIDAISVDPVDTIDYSIHKILFNDNMVIVENLANLEKLPSKFIFSATPLKYKESDGSPVRAIGIIL